MNTQKRPWTLKEIAFLIFVVALVVLVALLVMGTAPQVGQPEQDITGYITGIIASLLIIGAGIYIIRRQRRAAKGDFKSYRPPKRRKR